MKKQDVSQIRATPRKRRAGSRRRRIGGVLTAELIITMPIVIGLIFAMIEIGMILVAQQQIENAARVGCRVGTLPADDPVAQADSVQDTVVNILSNNRLICAVNVEFTPGFETGDTVKVHISLPMEAAAPDMLAFLGFTLEGRELIAECVMRRE